MTFRIFVLSLGLTLSISFNSSANNQIDSLDLPEPIELNTVQDQDGNSYTIKQLKGGLNWMTQNLNTKIKGSYCYDNKEENCETYGRLYTWKLLKKDVSYWVRAGNFLVTIIGGIWPPVME